MTKYKAFCKKKKTEKMLFQYEQNGEYCKNLVPKKR